MALILGSSTGFTITGGVTLTSQVITTYAHVYLSTQSNTNSGSNGIHLDGESWSSSVPVGAVISVAGDPRVYTVTAVIAPGDPGNSSGNWFYVVNPTDGSFAGGTNLTFSWN